MTQKEKTMIQRHIHRLRLIVVLSLIGLGGGIAPLPTHALPLIWEEHFGGELANLTGADDQSQGTALSFDFNFFGTNYTTVFVSTNGVISLGADAAAGYDPDLPQDFLSASTPVIAPFWSDLDLSAKGAVFFNDFGDRAVVTWADVGAFINPHASFTFQLQLTADGRLIFGYDTIADTVSQLDEDLVVGLSRGNGSFASRRNFQPDVSQTMSGTVYQVFEQGSEPFDLEGSNLMFMPPFLPPPQQPLSLFASAPPPLVGPPAPVIVPEPDGLVMLGLGVLVLSGLGWRRWRRAAPKSAFNQRTISGRNRVGE
jgi:hypothetical protein